LLLELYIDTPSSLLVTALFTIILSLELLRATPYLLLLRFAIVLLLDSISATSEPSLLVIVAFNTMLLLEYAMCIP